MPLFHQYWQKHSGGSCEFMKELKFTDSAFTCEVILRNQSKALYEAAQPQMERLKKIANLGLIAYINETAIHSKHHHLVGLLRIFEKLLQQPRSLGLPKDFLWSFWVRLCFGQTGHAAFVYDAEKTVLLSCHIDKEFYEKVRVFLNPVINKIQRCPKCSVAENCRDISNDRGDRLLDGMIKKNQWRRLYLWVAALKLTQEKSVFSILSRQANDTGKGIPSFSEQEAYKMLICPQCKWNRAIERLNRLDYVCRDLAYTGRLRVQFDVDNMVAQVNSEDYEDWNLLKQFDEYLIDTTYANSNIQAFSAIFQRALASLLINGEINLEQLFGIDPGCYYSDEDLKSKLVRHKLGRELFDKTLSKGWICWDVSTWLDKNRTPYEIESSLTGMKKTYLSAPSDTKIICYKAIQPHKLYLGIRYNGNNDRPEIKGIVRIIRSILRKQYPLLDSGKLISILAEALCGVKIEHNLPGIIERLAPLSSEHLFEIKKVANIVLKKYSGDKASIPISIRVGDLDYSLPLSPVGSGINIMLMHAAIYGSEELRKKTKVNLEKASKILLSELLLWQPRYFSDMSKKVENLMTVMQNDLIALIKQNKNVASNLEYYAFLEALKCPSEKISFRFVLPNLILFKDNGNKENEYDIASIFLKSYKEVEIWIWGVSSNQDISIKQKEDHGKIQILKDKIGNRWGGEIRVVTNYICCNNRELILDIDGRQEHRQL